MAGDATAPSDDPEAEVRADTRLSGGGCSVCEWLGEQPEPATWDRMLAGPVGRYGHRAIYTAMKRRGYTAVSSKPIESHRSGGHRVRPA